MLRVIEDYIFFLIACCLPGIARVGFLNVNQIKFYLIFVLPIEPVERGNLPAEWRSGVTAKDQDDWLLASKIRKPHPRFLVKCFQRKIRRFFAYCEIAL